MIIIGMHGEVGYSIFTVASFLVCVEVIDWMEVGKGCHKVCSPPPCPPPHPPPPPPCQPESTTGSHYSPTAYTTKLKHKNTCGIHSSF